MKNLETLRNLNRTIKDATIEIALREVYPVLKTEAKYKHTEVEGYFFYDNRFEVVRDRGGIVVKDGNDVKNYIKKMIGIYDNLQEAAIAIVKVYIAESIENAEATPERITLSLLSN